MSARCVLTRMSSDLDDLRHATLAGMGEVKLEVSAGTGWLGVLQKLGLTLTDACNLRARAQ